MSGACWGWRSTDFRKNGLLYTFTSRPVTAPADLLPCRRAWRPNCQTVITGWSVIRSEDHGGQWTPAARGCCCASTSHSSIIMAARWPYRARQNALHLALGDGGGANDSGVGHAPNGNAQTLTPEMSSARSCVSIPWAEVGEWQVRNSGQQPVLLSNEWPGKGNSRIRTPVPIECRLTRTPACFGPATSEQNDIEEVDMIRSGGNTAGP